VGNALENLGRPAACIEWMDDWRTRDGVRPWMVSALVVSYRTLKSADEALEAGRGALRLAPDHSYPLHRLWVAFEETVRGDAASGRAALQEISPDALNSYYQCLRWMLQAMVDSSPEGLKSALKALPTLQQEAALLRAWRQAVRLVARSQGGFRGFWTRFRFWR